MLLLLKGNPLLYKIKENTSTTPGMASYYLSTIQTYSSMCWIDQPVFHAAMCKLTSDSNPGIVNDFW